MYKLNSKYMRMQQETIDRIYVQVEWCNTGIHALPELKTVFGIWLGYG